MNGSAIVLNGPNLGRLGVREVDYYGTAGYAELEALCVRAGVELGLSVQVRQTNHEGELLGWLHEAADRTTPVVLNAGGWTHTSVALGDACAMCTAPLVEVHISNVFARERFRHRSFVSAHAAGVIAGLGFQGYVLALDRRAEWRVSRAGLVAYKRLYWAPGIHRYLERFWDGPEEPDLGPCWAMPASEVVKALRGGGRRLPAVADPALLRSEAVAGAVSRAVSSGLRVWFMASPSPGAARRARGRECGRSPRVPWSAGGTGRCRDWLLRSARRATWRAGPLAERRSGPPR